MLEQYDYLLVVDLEATCCNKGSIPRREMEIIEIGAVMVSTTDLQPVSEFRAFVQPVRHTVLTAFCSEITSISQDVVDEAAKYPEVLKEFTRWIYQYPNFLFCSWGDYDKTQFVQDCSLHRVSYPFASAHLNLKKQFSAARDLTKDLGMKEALQAVDIELIGTHHCGIDDARNIARLLPYIFQA